MKGKLSGKNGVVIDILIKQLKSKRRKNKTTKVTSNEKTTKKTKIKKHYSFRNLKTSDLRNISMGIWALRKIINEGLDIKTNEMLKGDKDVPKLRKELLDYRYVMSDFIRRIENGVITEFEIKTEISNLSKINRAVQAARDGIILKQEEREEIVDGEKRIIKHDIPITSREVEDILKEYEEKKIDLSCQKLENYLAIGLGFISMLGSIVNNNPKKHNSERGAIAITSLGTMVIGGLKLLEGVLETDDIRKEFELYDEKNAMINELLENEKISSEEEKRELRNIQRLSEEERKTKNRILNKELAFDVVLDLAAVLISGLYVNKNIQIKENGKIDGKILASTLISLRDIQGVSRNLVNGITGIKETKKDEERFKEISQKVKDILEQMEEKVYPLESVEHSFNSILINNLEGKFYPQKNYETGKTEYSTIINIPEFSMKRGDVVLLSGESGVGKSTFLRLLKRGDINNRKAIELDNKEKVDSLGKEYIAFRPKIELGDENNILYQLTGKNSLKDLTKKEEERLLTTLREMKLDNPNLLQQLTEKKFMQFSTGEQKRLILSKLFYRIKDGKSVIIVDEPVGNVEDNLIREQLKIIKRYAQSRNVMLLLTTHRVDLAEDLATKRYHINKQGTLEQIPLKQEPYLEEDFQK